MWESEVPGYDPDIAYFLELMHYPDYDPATALAPLKVFIYETREAGNRSRAPKVTYNAFSPGHDGLAETGPTSKSAADGLLRQVIALGEHPDNGQGFEIEKTTLKDYQKL